MSDGRIYWEWVNWCSKGLLGEYLQMMNERAWNQVLLWGKPGPQYDRFADHINADDELVIIAAWSRDEDPTVDAGDVPGGAERGGQSDPV